MLRLKKSFGTGISALLLLIFSVTILPLDFLHNHKQEQLCREARATGTCHHKLHVSDRGSFCWVCAIHVDKTFNKADTKYSIENIPVVSFFKELKITAPIVELLLSTLRGPPGNP
ncbi:hypothetical protein GS399_02010 [Pedobacter sp. HMF7647]|uniref:DUF2946 domain-containing protein n=1 Tax=Hufsiella arboris TaxID=2695275 RepID=A0A7K1Y6H9_9SPHI|nr:hypothetical protein [Hufsiella arboris]MXV49729.1 hypothetical protein [Hufsiella arboris]